MLEIVEIILWYTAVSICFILMVIFYNQYRKREIAKPFFLGLTLFMITYGIARLIENIRRYSIGSYNDIFDAWVAGTQITGINFILRFLYYAIAWTGISIMFLEMEKFIFKGQTKYIIGILSIIVAVVTAQMTIGAILETVPVLMETGLTTIVLMVYKTVMKGELIVGELIAFRVTGYGPKPLRWNLRLML